MLGLTLVLAAIFSVGQTTPSPGGGALFLTPYLERGQVKEAQRLSLVGPLNGSGIASHTGYLTVNASLASNLYFWFVPAEMGASSAPLLVWLDGGPGSSSLFGLFVLTGPFVVDKDGQLHERAARWTKRYHLLYIDNPVGAGFSFTNSSAGYARSEEDVARDLYVCLLQFVQLFPQVAASPLYLGGLSYAGKYVPALGYRIHTQNPAATVKLHLQGLYIGGPFSDPATMLPVYGDFLYHTGLLSGKARDHLDAGMAEALNLMAGNQYIPAYRLYASLFLAGGFLQNVSGYAAHSSILRTTEPPSEAYYVSYVNRPEVRAAIHAGDGPFQPSSQKVFDLLVPDFLQTVKPWLAMLMDRYKVLLFNGQLDMIVCVPCTLAMLDALPWSGQAAFREADRAVWRLNSEVAGYAVSVGNFSHVVVLGAGHLVPMDQPDRAWNMIQRFVDGVPFA